MFKKKAGIKRDVRSRNNDDDTEKESGPSQLSATSTTNDETGSGSAVVLKKRKVQSSNPLGQGSSTASSRKQEAGSYDDEDDFDEFYEKKDASKASASRNDDATRTNTWYDEISENGIGAAPKTGATNNDDGMYRGKAAYNKFTNPSNSDSSNQPKGMAKGPVRANNNVRTVTMIDYQPSVCKPYKETGMCGYGDSCIYLHDRSDYLAGWQLDKLPNSNPFGKRGDLLEKAKEEEEEDLPFACLICRKQFTDPVVTKCGHYFCMSCAIKRYEKTSKCFACNRQTQGIFNSATKILDRMASIRSALQEEREAKEWKEENNDVQQTSGELLEGVEIGTA
ncbi:uncharacterized protein FA14DRAFT_161229 [Meira miltonrushii]|uniref:Pre-mRNA-splicing factor CWC24 n=1 Tax=Meira miltonrushii TaxID=1280837 RepID=A0A316V8F7_9BASI|nr:uncharacterized protein FA14DRAFT_161229 [Meira miltonrushii]PWN33308.1 hypothetical protein FA14DRAFT_161229 [Meira miltonrushii]